MKNTILFLGLTVLISGCAARQVQNSELGTMSVNSDRYNADVEECVGYWLESTAETQEELEEFRREQAERTFGFRTLASLIVLGNVTQPNEERVLHVNACMEEKNWTEW